MGVFEKLKRFMGLEKNESAFEEEHEAEDKLQRAEKEDRCFIFLVEEVADIDNSTAVALVGHVHGEIHLNDAIYIYQGGHKVQMAGVAGLQTSPGESVGAVTDSRAAIKVHGVKKDLLNPFPVVSSIPPQVRLDVNENLENPRLLAMLMERKSLKESEEFIEELNEELQESHFLMAIYFDAKSPQSDEENEKSVMVDDKMMNIPLMSDPEDEQKKLVPIFTHWNAIQRWSGVYDENKPQVMVMNLFDARTMSKGLGGEIIVNPFGEEEMRLTSDVLNQLLK